MLKLLGGEKPVRLNPYKTITGGTVITVSVDDVITEARVPGKGTYTYLTVGGVEYYVSAILADGGDYTTEDVVVPPKVAKDPSAPKRTRKAKAVAVAVAEAEAEEVAAE